MSRIKKIIDFLKRVYALCRPFGRKKLIFVFFLSLGQGIFQVVGVTSIFPFLALAADTDRFRSSELGQTLLAPFPDLTNQQLLLAAGLFAIVMLLFANGFALFAESGRVKYTTQLSNWLRNRILRKIMARPYGDFLNLSTAELQKKIVHDITMFTSSILLPILDTISRLLTIGLIVYVLIRVEPIVAISSAVALLIFYWAIFRLLRSGRFKISQNMKTAGRGSFRSVMQLLEGTKTAKVHCAEETFIRRYQFFSKILSDTHAKQPYYQSAPRCLLEPLAFGALVAYVVVSSLYGEDLQEILPKVGIIALAAYRLLPNAQLIYSQLTTISSQRYSMDEISSEFEDLQDDRFKEVLDAQFHRPNAIELKNAISLKDLKFHYPGSKEPVLKGISFNIAKNSCIGIIGSTGCGKSTLVDLLLGLHLPSSGTIMIDDQPLSSSNRRSWRQSVGYVPQDIYLLDETIAANVAYGIPEDEVDQDRVEEVCRAAQIHEHISTNLPNGYQTTIGERGVRLSGGQRQRLGLARALYHKPSVLLLDEATSALDIETEKRVMETINTLQGSLTLIIIAHRLQTLEHCDNILHLEAGSSSILTIDELKAKKLDQIPPRAPAAAEED